MPSDPAAPDSPRIPRRAFGLRARLAAIVLAAIAPLLVVAAARAAELRRDETRQALAARSAVLEDSGDRVGLLVEAVRQILKTVSRLPQARDRAGPVYRPVLGSLLDGNPYCTTILAADEEGRVFASGNPAYALSIGDRAYFRETLAADGFVVGGFILSRSTGLPALALAYAAPGEPPGSRSVLVAPLKLEALQESFPRAGPGGTIIELFDAEGRRLAACPADASRGIGQKAAAPLAGILAAASAYPPGFAAPPARIGREWVLTLPLRFGGAGSPELVFAASFDEAAILGPSRRHAASYLALQAALALAAAASAWVMGSLWITRRLRAVAAAAGAFRSGDLAARARVAGGDEIAELGEAFDSMAAAVESRAEEAARSERALAEGLAAREILLREARHRVKNNLQVISSILGIHAREDESGRGAAGSGGLMIEVMSLVHDGLGAEPEGATLDALEFLVSLSSLVSASPRIGGRCAISTVASRGSAGLRLEPDAAIAVGLICAELAANSADHASGEGRAAKARVSLASDGGALRLSYEDDGPGIAAFPSSAERRGLAIVAALSAQLGGEPRFETGPGARFELAFPSRGPARAAQGPAALPPAKP